MQGTELERGGHGADYVRKRGAWGQSMRERGRHDGAV